MLSPLDSPDMEFLRMVARPASHYDDEPVCAVCDGSGEGICPKCSGQGVTAGSFQRRWESVCSECGGMGLVTCRECGDE